MPQSLRSFLAQQLDKFWETIGLRIELRRKRSSKLQLDHRYDYQKRHIAFDVQKGARVLDIGSGGDPFPGATVLVERYLQPKFRTETLVTNDKPLVVADIHYLPFSAKSFDFVYSAHVLEVVDNPILACSEMMRVGSRGYIETPIMGKDVLFSWAKNMQKWHVVGIGPHLCFFEYSLRQQQGINSDEWRQLIFNKWHHPLQDLFWENQDLFNVMFLWKDRFSVFVFYLDGSVKTLNTSADTAAAALDMPLVNN